MEGIMLVMLIVIAIMAWTIGLVIIHCVRLKAENDDMRRLLDEYIKKYGDEE